MNNNYKCTGRDQTTGESLVIQSKSIDTTKLITSYRRLIRPNSRYDN